VQPLPITTKVMSSNPVNGGVYSIQHYAIKFVSDLRQVGGFLCVLRFPPPTKLTRHDIPDIVESGVKHHTITTTTVIINSKVLCTLLKDT
jgi:hypothetical protein